jgi:hypothetical protein
MTMDRGADAISSADSEIVRQALRAAVEGPFFPDEEFSTLFGVDRNTANEILVAWPERTVGPDTFRGAVIGSLNNLLGYPHGKDEDLLAYVPEGRKAIEKTLARLVALGI